ncbi:hypothetical protein [Stratiformator vulcanicus]|uniref:hypothetical protein n=1 Tax=Stratiformator vulcanicus TaxID=2527980 RepID=UPI00119D94C8|nr:hypothetical protein [Stratiformator vulcanicus]
MTENEFAAAVAQCPHFQWAVVSAIPAHCQDDLTTLAEAPYADGNTGFWSGVPSPQYSLAAFEIVCWDSSAILCIGADETIAAAFENAFPGAVDLDEINRLRH